MSSQDQDDMQQVWQREPESEQAQPAQDAPQPQQPAPAQDAPEQAAPGQGDAGDAPLPLASTARPAIADIPNPYIEDLWEMTNWAFTSPASNPLGSMLPTASTVPTEVRSRLLNNIAQLKQGATPHVVDSIRADIKLCIASGWVAADLGGTLQDLLDKVTNGA